jgi:hypothetical protein
VRLTIRFKLIATVVAGLLVVSATAAGLMRFVYERAARLAAEASIRNASAAFANLEANESGKLGATLRALAANAELRRLFLAGDRDGLQRAAAPVFRELRDRHLVTHWYFHGPDRRVFLRVHQPDLAGDEVARPSLLRAAESGDLATGVDLGKTAFALRAVLPWRGEAELIGYLELGQEIDDFLGVMKSQTGDDYALFLEKAHVDRAAWADQQRRAGRRDGWDDHPVMVLAHATAPLAWPGDARPASEVSPAGETLKGGGLAAERVLGVFAARDAEGHAVGAVVVSHDMKALRAGLAEVRLRVVLAVALLAAGLAALVVFMLDTLVFDRLRRMSELFERIPERMARGDYRIEVDLAPPPDDELGRFERLFHRAIEVIGGALREIGHAQGSKDRDRGARR